MQYIMFSRADELQQKITSRQETNRKIVPIRKPQ